MNTIQNTLFINIAEKDKMYICIYYLIKNVFRTNEYWLRSKVTLWNRKKTSMIHVMTLNSPMNM